MNNDVIIPLLLVLVVFLTIIVLVSLFFIAYLVLRKQQTNTPKDSNEVVSSKPKTNYTCSTHHDRPSTAACYICDKIFCSECIKEIDHLYFCPEHLSTYATNKWTPITDQRTTPKEYKNAEYIYAFKKKIWRRNEPSFIVTDYKIDIATDQIESFVKLHVLEKDAPKLKNEIMEDFEHSKN